MFQNHITVENRHKKFIRTVCKTGIVYGLKTRKGFATSSSVHYHDQNGESIGIICFWANKAMAKSCIKGEWENYEPTEIILSDFMEKWCVGMENDGLLIGTQFDQNMFGFEVEPLELIIALSTELKSIGKDLSFLKFNGVEDLEAQIKAIMD